MKKRSVAVGLALIVVFAALIGLALAGCQNSSASSQSGSSASSESSSPSLSYVLPAPKTEGDMSVEEALANRRSRRAFTDRSLSTEQLSQILWAAYGITGLTAGAQPQPDSYRTAPSAGALYPLEIYVVIGSVTGIEPGVYKYIPWEHRIVQSVDGDIREALASLSPSTSTMITDAPITVVYAAVFERTTVKYGDRGRERYVYIEVGHSAQNVYLQAEAMGLGTCAMGAFDDNKVSELLNLQKAEKPLYIMPVGYY